jgi:signal transduction histidine kinase
LSEDVHALSYQLHPSVVEDLGLADALRGECERFSRREAITTDVQVAALPDALPRDTAICLYRVAQEALRNVVRHAQAGAVVVSLASVRGGLQLAVRDDGIGFDPSIRHSHNHSHSLGHASMRERTRLLGGSVEIQSTRGGGTTVVAWVPLKEEHHASTPSAAG